MLTEPRDILTRLCDTPPMCEVDSIGLNHNRIESTIGVQISNYPDKTQNMKETETNITMYVVHFRLRHVKLKMYEPTFVVTIFENRANKVYAQFYV